MKIKKLLFVLLLVLALAACGGDDSGSDTTDDAEPVASSGDPVNGENLYVQSCSACHGVDALGLPNLGKDLTTSEFVNENSDEELLAFVKTGRPVGDPLNTTGVDMPPKGGNPALTDDQILDIIAYIRQLSQ